VRFLGALSYPIYLYHGWGLELGQKLSSIEVVQFSIGVAATILAATGSYYCVEKPFLSLKKRFAPAPATVPLPPRSALA
jgi:peptidoglycan/LPS O-acetylase OafA/YrhL